MIVGAIGALGGYWIGLCASATFIESQEKFISVLEYNRLYRIHLALAIVAMLGASLGGCIIGIGMHTFLGRRFITR